jgi:hypothetical protein
VSGLVAEVDGRTLQVQGASTQTAVTWTGTTRFTREVAVSKAAVRAGVCVAVRSLPDGQNGTPSDQSSVIAQSVSISQPVSGRCQVGFGRGGPGRGGVPGAQPTRSGQPTGSPATGGASRARGFGGVGGAFGTVTAVGATGFTVESMVPERPSGTASGSPTTPATTQRRVVTVTTSPATTYTSTVAATASAAKVGTCVTALGTADSTGAIAARSIAVRPAQNGSCVTGFGRPGGLGAATTHG